MSATPHRSHVSHALCLSTGRMLDVGEVAEVDPDDPHDAALIAAGHLVAVTPSSVSTPAPRPRRRHSEGGSA